MQEQQNNSMRLTVNGQEKDFPGGTLAALLAHQGMEQAAIVAEVNGTIIPQENFSRTELSEGDVVELVRFVGGG